MPDHFSAIGIPISSLEDLQLEISKAAVSATMIKCKKGHYLRWTSKQGAELWIQQDHHNNLVGATPFFQGKARMTVALTKEISRKTDTPLEGAIYGWAGPENDNPESGAYPFVFDLVDKGVYEPFDFPFTSQVQLCAFTHDLNIYNSEEEYNNSQEDIKFATESFVPSSLLEIVDTKFDSTGSTALFSGHVLEASELINPLTNNHYHWMYVKTLGGEIDVVSELSMLPNPVTIGGVIRGAFWLCGRIMQPRFRQKKSLLKILFH